MSKMLYEKLYIDAIADKIRSLVPSLYKRKFTTSQMPEAIQRVYDEGKTKGHDEGFSEGKNRGYTQGFTSGKARGHREGYDEGYGEGVSFGIERGESVGYSNGYKDGAEQAIKSIPRAEGVGF